MKLKPTEQLFNDEDLARSVDCVAALSVQIKALEAARDERIQVVQEEANHTIRALQDEVDRELVAAERYAQQHRSRLFGKRKSASTSLADYGLRKTTPKLVLITKTADQLAEELQRLKQLNFIRTTVKIHRPSVIKAIKDGNAFLAKHARVEQREEFFVKPKTDKAEE